MSRIPRVAYEKAVDVWMTCCLVMVSRCSDRDRVRAPREFSALVHGLWNRQSPQLQWCCVNKGHDSCVDQKLGCCAQPYKRLDNLTEGSNYFVRKNRGSRMQLLHDLVSRPADVSWGILRIACTSLNSAA